MADITNHILHGRHIIITHLDKFFGVLLDNIFFVDLGGDIVKVFCAIGRVNITKKHVIHWKKIT